VTEERRLVLSADIEGWPIVYRHVLLRDQRCVAAYFPRSGPRLGVAPIEGLVDHYCRGRYGQPINWSRTAILAAAERKDVELDHVKEHPKMGQKAPDDTAHLVVACYGWHQATQKATSEEGREHERAWLAALYPDVWAGWIQRQEEARDAETPGAE
jgi:hypothetical protein